MESDDTYRMVLHKLRLEHDDVPLATSELMKLAADMLEAEIEYSGQQAVLVKEQQDINRDLVSMIKMLKDLLISVARKHNV